MAYGGIIMNAQKIFGATAVVIVVVLVLVLGIDVAVPNKGETYRLYTYDETTESLKCDTESSYGCYMIKYDSIFKCYKVIYIGAWSPVTKYKGTLDEYRDYITRYNGKGLYPHWYIAD